MGTISIKQFTIKFGADYADAIKGLGLFTTEANKKLAEFQRAWASTNAEVQKESARVTTEMLKNEGKLSVEKEKTARKQIEINAKTNIELQRQSTKREADEKKRNERMAKETEKRLTREKKAEQKYAKDHSAERIAALNKLEAAQKEFEAKSSALRAASVKENETDGVKQIAMTRNRLKAEADLEAAKQKQIEAMMQVRLQKAAGNAQMEVQIRQRAERAITASVIAEAKKRDAAGEVAATKLQKSARFGEDIATIAGGGLQNANFTGLGATVGDMIAGPIGGAIGTAIGGAVTLLMKTGVGKALADLFTPASDKVNKLSEEIDGIQGQVQALASASATINLAISTGSGEDFTAALNSIKEAIKALPEDADVARSQLQAMLNVPGGPTVEGLKQIDEKLKSIKGEGEADILAKQFEIGNLALDTFRENLMTLADQRDEADGNALKQAAIDKQIQDEIALAVQNRLRMREAEAEHAGRAFDAEKERAIVTAEVLTTFDQTNQLIGATTIFTDQLVASNYDLVGVIDEQVDGYGAVSNQQAEIEATSRAINDTMLKQESVLGNMIEEASTYGQTQDQIAKAEINQLKIKQTNMKFVKAAIDAQIRALKQFIASQGVSIKAEQDRKKAAEDLAKQQKIIADIMEAQKKGVAYTGATTTATTSGTFNAGEANAMLAKLEADSAALDRGINEIGKDIESLEKTGKKRNEVEKGSAKSAEDTAKKKAEEAKKQLEIQQKLDEKKGDIEQSRLDALAKLADEERQKKVKQQQDQIKSQFDDMKIAEQRKEAEATVVKNIKAAGKSILDSIVANTDRAYTAVNSILNGFRSKSEQLLNKIDEMRDKQSDEADKLLARQRELAANVDELATQIAQKAAELEASKTEAGPEGRRLGGLQRQESGLKEDLINLQAQERSAIATAEATAEAFKASAEYAKLTADRAKLLQTIDNKKTTSQNRLKAETQLAEIEAKIADQIGQVAFVTKKYADDTARLNNQLRDIQEQISIVETTAGGWTDTIKRQTDDLQKLNDKRDEENRTLNETTKALANLSSQSFAGQVEEAATAVAEIGGRVRDRATGIAGVSAAGTKGEALKARAAAGNIVSAQDIALLEKYAQVMAGVEYQTAIANETDEKRKQLLIDTQRVTLDLIATNKEATQVDTYRIIAQKELQDNVAAGTASATQLIGEYNTRVEDMANKNKTFVEQTKAVIETQMGTLKKQIDALNALKKGGAELTEDQTKQLEEAGNAYNDLQEQVSKGTGAMADAADKDADTVGQKITKIMGFVKQGAQFLDDVSNTAIEMAGGDMSVTEKITAGAELAQKVGEALLGSKNPKIKLVGAFIVGAALITKAIAKIIQAIKGEGMDAQQKAQLQADTEKAINDLYNARLSIMQKLAETGNTRIDQAKEQQRLEQEIFNQMLKQSAEARELNKLSSENVARKQLELQQEKALLEIKLAELEAAKETNREERKKVLDKYGIDYKGSTKGETNDAITETQARLTQINTTLDIGNTILDHRVSSLQKITDILNEQLAINKLLISLGADEQDQLEKNVKLTSKAITDLLTETGALRYGEGIYAGLRLTEPQKKALKKNVQEVADALKSGDVEKAKKEMLDLPEDILFAIQDQIGAWQGATTELATYLENMKKVTAELEKQTSIYDLQMKLNDEKLRSAEIDQVAHDKVALKLMEDQLTVIEASRDAYASELEWLVAIETQQANIYELQQKMNGETGKGNEKLVQMIRNYQKILREFRASGGGQDKAQLEASANEMREYLKSIGQTPEQIDKFIGTLPAFAEGGSVNQTGPILAHAGEHVATADAVGTYGKDFYDALNKMAGMKSTGSGIPERFLRRFSAQREAAGIMNSINQTNNITQYNNFAAMPAEKAIPMTGRDIVGTMQNAAESGKFFPGR